MIKGTSEYLEEVVKKYHCPDHDNPLVVAWHAEENSYVIRCGAGHYPEEVTAELSRTRQYKVGELEPVGSVLDLVPKTDLATGALLGPDMVHALISYAERYGLDPYRGHVVVMYGKPYIGLDGYLYHANLSRTPYQLRSHPLDEDARKNYRIDENDHAWTCEVILPLSNQSFTGLGVVTREEIVAMSTKNPHQLRSPVVAAHPWQMAQKRAEWQALRRAFPIGESEEKREE